MDLAELEELKRALESEWHVHQVPEYFKGVYRTEFAHLSPIQQEMVIPRHIEDLKHSRSPLQLALKSTTSREETLNSIITMNSHLAKSGHWENSNKVKIECAELLHALRLLSLNTVESIVKWQEHIQCIILLSADRQRTPSPVFLWGELNYLAKMRDDLEFLAYSELAKIFSFAKRRDPFMILPSKGPANGKSSYFIEGDEIIIPLPSLLIRRIQLAETVIFHENNKEITGNPHPSLYRSSISLNAKSKLNSDETSPKSEIREETHKINKAEALQRHILAEMIYRALLEDEIENEGLEDYAQIAIHRAIDKRKTTIANATEAAKLATKEYELRTAQLSQLLYKNLTEEFVNGK